MRLYDWLGAVSWRWRLAHFFGAALLELGCWRFLGFGGLGAYTYAWREIVQYESPRTRKPLDWHVLDWVPAWIAFGVVNVWMVL